MKVRFTQDFIYRGRSRGMFMVDYKEGQVIRIPQDHFEQALAAGVIEELEDDAVKTPKVQKGVGLGAMGGVKDDGDKVSKPRKGSEVTQVHADLSEAAGVPSD